MKVLQSSYRNLTDEVLVKRIPSGDPRVIDELYRRYQHRLFTYFCRMLGNDREKAQDFLQDVFLKIIENPDRFRGESRFTTWVFTIAHNMCKNEYRRQQVRKIIDPAADPDSVSSKSTDSARQIEQKIDREQLTTLVFKILDDFNHEHRSTFILRFQEQFSIKEISQMIGCPEGTVKSRLFYVTKSLSQRLREFNPHHQEVTKHEVR